MADQKLSELIEVISIEDYDSIYVVVGGDSRRIAKHNFAVDLEVAQAAHADNADHALEADHATNADNSLEADQFSTARNITLDGDVDGSTLFDGSADATITVVVHDDSHEHSSSSISSITPAVVGDATKGLSAGVVGSYAYASVPYNQAASFGSTKAGSGLRTSGSSYGENTDAQSLSGTWRCMGNADGYDNDGNRSSGASLWLRIS